MRDRKRKQFQRNFKNSFIVGRVTKSIVTISLLLLVGMLYLSQQNIFAVRGVRITELETKKATLEEERDRLQLEATRLQSIQELERRLDESDSPLRERYVPIDKINYLPSSNVAAR